MKILRFDETKNLIDCLESIKNEEDTEIKIFTAGSDLFKKNLNREIIQILARDSKKTVSFEDNAPKLGEAQPEIPEKTKQVGAPKENLGFVEGTDIAATGEKDEEVTTGPKKGFKLPSFKLPKGKKLYIIIGACLVVFLMIFLTFVFLPSADVILTTESNYKESEQVLTASNSATSVDASKGIIPLKVLDVSEEDNITANSTGTKTTGTAAKGRVTIVNRDTVNGKTFFQGTTITNLANQALTFSLDNTATISAAPAGGESPVGVNVTANTIGEQSNLSSGTVFKVGDADINLVFAKNDTDFTGGTSKKITVVSGDDQSKAKDTLLKKLEDKAKSDLKSQNPGIIIPDGGLSSTIINETYSKNVGDEAQNFQLSLQVKFTATTFSEDDLRNVLVSSLTSSIPNGYEMDKKNSTVTSEILEKDGANLKISGKIKASLVPSLDQNEIKNRISGKSFANVDSYLRSLDSISSFDIKISPSIFRFFGILPLSKNKIRIEIIQGT